MENIIENNQVVIMGSIVSDFVYSHDTFGEKFYMMDVEVERLSGISDFIPVMVSEKLFDVNKNIVGKNIVIYGQFRSYNMHENDKSRVILSVFAKSFEFVDKIEVDANNNQIYLEGYICKKPVYRKTSLGKDITDLFFAVNRPYGKTDYIPSICWGKTAQYAGFMDVGSKCSVKGRIQSRDYIKKISEEEIIQRRAYELSIYSLAKID